MRKYQQLPVVVVSAFLRFGDKYLLVKDPRFGFYRVPGGKLRFGERVEDALKREIKEELNLNINIVRFLGFGQDTIKFKDSGIEVSRVILYFECEVKNKDELKVRAKNEINNLIFLSLSEMKEHGNLEPAMLDLFERM